MTESGESSGDVESHVVVAFSSGEPGPGTIAKLHLGQFAEGSFGFRTQAIGIEENADVSPGLAFIQGLANPGSFQQGDRLEVLIFLHRRVEGFGAFPLVKDPANLGIGVCNGLAEEVRIVAIESLL